MRSKAAPYILLALLLVAAILLIRFRQDGRSGQDTYNKPGDRTGGTSRDRGFDRRTSSLEYTRHARCRMDCREITASEVEDIMKKGQINYRKSNAKDRPCPTYAVEGYTSDEQHVRIVFAQCNEITKVVTCIDLEKEWQCACPGDDNKYKNQER